LLVGEGPRLRPPDDERPEWPPLAEHGHGEDGDHSEDFTYWKRVACVEPRVLDVHHLMIENGAPRYRIPRDRSRVRLTHSVDPRLVHPSDGRGTELPVLDNLDDDAEGGLAELAGAVHDGFEDWPLVGGRARDDAQDLTGRHLLLQSLRDLRMSLRECPVLLLQLREQPGVLDCDDPLVSEGRHQLDFFVTKWSDLIPVQAEHT